MSRAGHAHPGIHALAVCAFAIGLAEFIVVGILPAIAADLNVPLARAGGLLGGYALALGSMEGGILSGAFAAMWFTSAALFRKAALQ